MNILSRALLRLGYVRLRDFGYTLTSEGRIVELPRVTDDRFSPPPWEPIAWQQPTAFLPAQQPPVPRPLPPPPQADETRGARGGSIDPETQAPVTEATGAMEHDTTVRSEPEDEEWEWRMALAQARERASAGRAPAAMAKLTGRRSDARSGSRPARSPGGTVPPPAPGSAARARIAGPPAHPTGPLLARPGDAAGRVARGTEGMSARTGDALAAELAAEIEEELELEPDGTDFADGSRRHGIVRVEAGDTTALDVPAISPDAVSRPDDDVTKVDVGIGRLAQVRAEASAAVADPMPRHVFPAPAVPAPEKPAALPRLTSRLRRPTNPG
jgi:hypothetical protein